MPPTKLGEEFNFMFENRKAFKGYSIGNIQERENSVKGGINLSPSNMSCVARNLQSATNIHPN